MREELIGLVLIYMAGIATGGYYIEWIPKILKNVSKKSDSQSYPSVSKWPWQYPIPLPLSPDWQTTINI
jgi:hypothetical protein